MKYVNCNLCGADNWTVRYPATLAATTKLEADAFSCTNPGYGEHAQIVTCFECGYVYANPTWDDEELLQAYEAVEDKTYVEERDGRELTFQKHLEKIEALIGPANGRNLLDVGAYIGVFVEVAQRSGWDACGIEPSQWAVAEASKRGLNVLQGTLEAPSLQDKLFDVVTLWDVIEHVDDPKLVLAQSFERLKPGGTVVVHTMDIDSAMSRIMGKRWPWLMEMHIHFFSKRTLGEMLEKVGFEVTLAKTEGRYLRMGYLATRVGGISPFIGRILATIINKLGWDGVALPINFGDLFTVYAQKPHR